MNKCNQTAVIGKNKYAHVNFSVGKNGFHAQGEIKLNHQ
jgi:hypothetical protein